MHKIGSYKMKTSELIGPALDWAVAKCEGYPVSVSKTGFLIFSDRTIQCGPRGSVYSPSTNGAQGVPIIDRERIETRHDGRASWCAWVSKVGAVHGPTLLIAAMRCYVASKLGDEVNVPE